MGHPFSASGDLAALRSCFVGRIMGAHREGPPGNTLWGGAHRARDALQDAKEREGEREQEEAGRWACRLCMERGGHG